jgi:hypothetical protein
MARRNNIEERPIPINAVALAVGHLPETIWAKLEPEDVILDWDYSHGVSWNTARRLVDEFRAAEVEAERVTAERRRVDEEKQELESTRLRREAEALRPPRTHRVLGGVRTFVPGGGAPEPEWMRGPSTEADE